MEKLTLFDLLSFAIPGGTTMAMAYWVFINVTERKIGIMQLPDVLLAAVLLLLAYFIGHIVSELGVKLESLSGGLPKSWAIILEQNPALAQPLNDISKEVYNKPFIQENGTIDVTASGVFYDHAFHVLEVEGKLEKVRTLQTQYVFFRNSVAIGLLGTLACLTVGLARVLETGGWKDSLIFFSFINAMGCLLAMPIARRLSRKRRQMKMSATLHDFYAYYIVERKIKK